VLFSHACRNALAGFIEYSTATGKAERVFGWKVVNAGARV
jgi:hypothetical protein